MKRFAIVAALAVVAGAGAMFVRVGGGNAREPAKVKVEPMDLSSFSADKIAKPTNLLFIHHSCGASMLADAKADANGGGGKQAITDHGFTVHEATYGSKVGEHTDLFDWVPKFRTQWDEMRRVKHQDEMLPDGEANQVVMFKSCYPNNDFVGAGDAPGSAAGPELTIANAKATMIALRDELAKHPETLFVYITAPPRTPNVGKERLVKYALKKVLGKPTGMERWAQRGRWAAEFNAWVVAKDGWLKDYPLKNVAVYDGYGVLTDGGTHLAYVTSDPYDSHPNGTGNKKIAAELPSFLARAVRRAGLAD